MAAPVPFHPSMPCTGQNRPQVPFLLVRPDWTQPSSFGGTSLSNFTAKYLLAGRLAQAGCKTFDSEAWKVSTNVRPHQYWWRERSKTVVFTPVWKFQSRKVFKNVAPVFAHPLQIQNATASGTCSTCVQEAVQSSDMKSIGIIARRHCLQKWKHQ